MRCFVSVSVAVLVIVGAIVDTQAAAPPTDAAPSGRLLVEPQPEFPWNSNRAQNPQEDPWTQRLPYEDFTGEVKSGGLLDFVATVIDSIGMFSGLVNYNGPRFRSVSGFVRAAEDKQTLDEIFKSDDMAIEEALSRLQQSKGTIQSLQIDEIFSPHVNNPLDWHAFMSADAAGRKNLLSGYEQKYIDNQKNIFRIGEISRRLAEQGELDEWLGEKIDLAGQRLEEFSEDVPFFDKTFLQNQFFWSGLGFRTQIAPALDDRRKAAVEAARRVDSHIDELKKSQTRLEADFQLASEIDDMKSSEEFMQEHPSLRRFAEDMFLISEATKAEDPQTTELLGETAIEDVRRMTAPENHEPPAAAPEQPADIPTPVPPDPEPAAPQNKTRADLRAQTKTDFKNHRETVISGARDAAVERPYPSSGIVLQPLTDAQISAEPSRYTQTSLVVTEGDQSIADVYRDNHDSNAWYARMREPRATTGTDVGTVNAEAVKKGEPAAAQLDGRPVRAEPTDQPKESQQPNPCATGQAAPDECPAKPESWQTVIASDCLTYDKDADSWANHTTSCKTWRLINYSGNVDCPEGSVVVGGTRCMTPLDALCLESPNSTFCRKPIDVDPLTGCPRGSVPDPLLQECRPLDREECWASAAADRAECAVTQPNIDCPQGTIQEGIRCVAEADLFCLGAGKDSPFCSKERVDLCVLMKGDRCAWTGGEAAWDNLQLRPIPQEAFLPQNSPPIQPPHAIPPYDFSADAQRYPNLPWSTLRSEADRLAEVFTGFQTEADTFSLPSIGGAKAFQGCIFKEAVARSLVRPNFDDVDIQLSSTYAAELLQNDLFEGLLRVNRKGEVTFGVAESVERQEADNIKLVFKLRSEARWSDGSPVTPDDFVRTFERLHQEGIFTATIASKRDDSSLVISTPLNDIDIIGKLAAPIAMPIHASTPIPPVGEQLSVAKIEISNGPYRLVSVEDTVAQLAVNEHYWNKAQLPSVAYLQAHDVENLYNIDFEIFEGPEVPLTPSELENAYNALDAEFVKHPATCSLVLSPAADDHVKTAFSAAVEAVRDNLVGLGHEMAVSLSFPANPIGPAQPANPAIENLQVHQDNNMPVNHHVDHPIIILDAIGDREIKLLTDSLQMTADTDVSVEHGMGSLDFWRAFFGFGHDQTIAAVARCVRDPIKRRDSFLDRLIFEEKKFEDITLSSDILKHLRTLLEDATSKISPRERQAKFNDVEKAMIASGLFIPLYHPRVPIAFRKGEEFRLLTKGSEQLTYPVSSSDLACSPF